MESDGTNVQRLTDQGYAVSPSWSPNGQFLVVSWMRKYGPGAPGAQDIYIMDIASKQWVQLTHDGGRNDFPYWSPDGRYLYLDVDISKNASSGKTFVIPLRRGSAFPDFDLSAITSTADLLKIPGIRAIERSNVSPGPDPSTYAFCKRDFQCNLFRIALR